jgi:hypothetical protein
MNLQIRDGNMNIKIEGDKFKKSHVTGPRHNFLSLSLERGELNFNFVLKDLNLDSKRIILSNEEVREQVINGLDQINKELGTNYTVTIAEFFSNDSFLNDIYTRLTFDIINEVHGGNLLNS